MIKITLLPLLAIFFFVSSFAQGGVVPDPPPPFHTPLIANFSNSGNNNQVGPAGGGSVPGSDTRPEGTYNPQTPPGGDGSQNARSRNPQTPEQAAEARRQYAILLNSVKTAASTYAANVADYYQKLSEQPVVQQSAKYPRMAKYLNACKTEIDDIKGINNDIQDITTLDYNNSPATRSRLQKIDENYQSMMRNIQRAKNIENFIDNKPAIIGGFTNNAQNREKIIDHQISELTKQRSELVSAKSANDRLAILGILGLTAEMTAKNMFATLGLLVDNVNSSELKVLNLQFETEGVKLLNAGLAYSMKATDVFVQHWIEEDKPIDIGFLDELNNKAVLAAGLSYVDEAYFVEKGFDTYEALTRKWGQISDDYDLLDNQANETIRQIDFSIRQLKKMKQVNKAAPSAITIELNNFLMSDGDYPVVKHFDFIPVMDANLNISNELPGLTTSTGPDVFLFEPCLQIAKVKSDANALANASARYSTLVEGPEIFPGAGVPAAMKTYYSDAKAAFDDVKMINGRMQVNNYIVQQYTNSCYVDVRVIADLNNLIFNYDKSTRSLNSLRLAQKIYVDSGQLVERLQKLVQARDSFYTQLIDASRRLSGVISLQTSKPVIPASKIRAAKAKTIMQIKNYLDYSGTDIYTLLFKKYTDSIIQKPEMLDIVNGGFVGDFVKNNIASNTVYDIRLWLDLFSHLERSSLTKIKSSLNTSSSKTASDDLAIYYQAFLQARAGHKNIFTVIDSGIRQTFH